MVLARNGDAAVNGGVTANYVYGTSITFNNSNTDWVTLKDPNGVLADSVAYSTRSGTTVVPPSVSPTGGASFVLVDATADNAVIAGNAAWTVTPAGFTYGAGDRGSPGAVGNANYGPACTQQPGGEITTVTVTPNPANVTLNTTRPLSAAATDANGVPVQATFTWRSANEAVATVSAAGVVTGVSLGSTQIIARAPNGVEGSANVTVIPAGAPATITISINTPARIPVGFTKPAFPTVRDGQGNIISPPPPLTWTSSDEGVATVDPLGYITGTGIGTATIRATAENGVFGTATITIIAATAPTTAVYRNHLEFGVPSSNTRSIGRSEFRVTRAQYVAGYRAALGGAAWVSWNLNSTQFGAAPRCDCFSADPLLPPGTYRVVDFDYRNGGYDRGHMVQSESRTTTDQENAASFLLTNILPQAADNNQGPWLGFENWLNDRARIDGREVYVVAGGQYASDAPSLKNEGKVLIPSWTWKVAVIVPAGEGLPWVTSPDRVQVVAVRMPNRIEAGVPGSAVGIRNLPWQQFAVSVDQIEGFIGYDLLNALPDDVEAIVEAQVFGQAAVSPRLAGRP
ncbi:MAG: DNA/RNA non-specific endonuclease [Gemmatimonadaceae bacterium]|nr:DNA/RNA non-specific endonuclease [Gemmatimonadaceae bacterium]